MPQILLQSHDHLRAAVGIQTAVRGLRSCQARDCSHSRSPVRTRRQKSLGVNQIGFDAPPPPEEARSVLITGPPPTLPARSKPSISDSISGDGLSAPQTTHRTPGPIVIPPTQVAKRCIEALEGRRRAQPPGRHRPNHQFSRDSAFAQWPLPSPRLRGRNRASTPGAA